MPKKAFRMSDLWGVLKESGSEWVEDKAPKMSAALAYYTAISIAPLIIITMKIVGIFFLKKDQAGQLLHDQLSSLTGPQVATLTDAISATSKPGAGVLATLISVAIALMGASGVFGELQDSLNTIWEVRPKQGRGITGVIQDRFLSMTMVLGIAFLLLVSMFVSTVITGFSTGTIHQLFGGDGSVMQPILKGINIILSIVVITLLFAAIFRFLPDVKIGWGDVWLGAFVTAALFEGGKYALSEYFVRESPNSTYGAAGSLVAVLLWVYYSAYILFFGAEFTQVYANQFGSHIVPAANAEPLTEEMRARQGIPHAAPTVGGSPAAAGISHRPTSTMSSRPDPRRPAMATRQLTCVRPAQPPQKSYAARYVPVLIAAVVARLAYRRYHDSVSTFLPPASPAGSRGQSWRAAARRWATRAGLRAAVVLSKTRPGRAILRTGLRATLQQV